MDIEKLIKDTFTAHERDVPDDDRVLAAARQRIDRRRTVSRPLAVAAGVAVLSLAARSPSWC
jgi:trehalose-6-phosphatase